MADRIAFGVAWVRADEDYVRRAREKDIVTHRIRFFGPTKRYAEHMFVMRDTFAPVLLVVSDSHMVEGSKYYRPEV